MLSEVQGQGQLVKSICWHRHISLADLDKLIDTFSELTGYAVGVYPETNMLHSPWAALQQCVCVCGDEACGTAQSPAESLSSIVVQQ